MFIELISNNESLCSGSILSTKYILSAAHCFQNFVSADILGGLLDFAVDDPEYEVTVVSAQFYVRSMSDGKVFMTFELQKCQSPVVSLRSEEPWTVQFCKFCEWHCHGECGKAANSIFNETATSQARTKSARQRWFDEPEWKVGWLGSNGNWYDCEILSFDVKSTALIAVFPLKTFQELRRLVCYS